MKSWKSKPLAGLVLAAFVWSYVLWASYPAPSLAAAGKRAASFLAGLASPAEAAAQTPWDREQYSAFALPYAFEDISESGVALTLGDGGGMAGVPLGFSFSFYGENHQTATIAASGYICFDGQVYSEPTALPSPEAPNGIIAPFFAPLAPSANPGAAVYFKTLGEAPDRRFVVQWSDYPLSGDPLSRLSFQAILFESSREIQFHYKSMKDGSGETGAGPAGGSLAAIGVEAPDGRKGASVAYKKPGAVRSKKAFGFFLGESPFEQGRLLGDLDADSRVSILDQGGLTDDLVLPSGGRSSQDLFLGDLAPEPGVWDPSFGDLDLNILDHARLFEGLMGMDPLNPLISTTSHLSAAGGQTLSIQGSRFDPAPALNTVVFALADGGELTATAKTVDAEGTDLSVEVPVTPGRLVAVRVSSSGQKSNAVPFFLEGVPVIAGMNPDYGVPGDVIRIVGYGFDDDPAQNAVFFDGLGADVSRLVTDGACQILEVTVPENAATGPVVVTVGGQDSNEAGFTARAPLTAEIASPLADATITAPTALLGTAWDEDFSHFLLEYAPAGTGDYQQMSRGEQAVTAGVLGTFDPTLLENGIYDLRLTVFNLSGASASTEIQYLVDGGMKLGVFTISFTDLAIPLAGIPIQVTRTYDSRRRASSGDFGYGWTLEAAAFPKLRKNRPEGSAWVQQSSGGSFPTYSLSPSSKHVVAATLSDGTVLEFEFTPEPDSQALAPLTKTKAKYTAKNQTRATLAPKPVGVGGTEVLVDANGTLWTYEGDIYDPQEFVLTLENGASFDVEIGSGPTRIEDAEGNEITINENGIFHDSGRAVLFTRDGEGRVTAITDPMGKTLEYAYNAAGELAGFTDQTDNETGFAYSQGHYLTDITDALGVRAVKNFYDDSGRLVATEDAAGNRVAYNHDLAANQELVTDRLGNATLYEYDGRGNVTAKVDALGHRWGYAYDTYGNQLSQTDPLGNTTRYEYDDMGRRTKKIDPLGGTVEEKYDPDGRLTDEIDALGHQRYAEYNNEGKPIREQNRSGDEWFYAYDGAGNKTSATDPLGNVRTYSYDAFGNQTAESGPMGLSITNSYDDMGRQLSHTLWRTDAQGREVAQTTSWEYDAAGRVTRQVNAGGGETKVGYDALGRKISETNARNETTTYEYDSLGKLRLVTHSNGSTSEYQYDAEGRKVLERCSSCGAAGELRYEYDALGRVVKTIHADGTESIQQFDEAGRLVGGIDENMHQTLYFYDAAGRRTKIKDALGQESTYAYDAAGNLLSMTDPLGRLTRYEYNKEGMRTKIIFHDGTTQEMEYTELGLQAKVTDQVGKVTEFFYDDLGRQIRTRDAAGKDTHFTYDRARNKISQTDPKGHVTRWEYNSLNQMVRHELPLGQEESFTHNELGKAASHTDFNGQTITYTYDDMGRLARKDYPDASFVAYTYNLSGKRETVTDSRGTTSYEYDSRGRLTRETEPDGLEKSYTYDGVGNRLSVTTPGGTTLYEYDALNRLEKVKAPDGGETVYTYDAVGNRTGVGYPNGATMTYGYDDLNRLVSLVSKDDGGNVIESYAYTLGPAGNRTRVVEHGGRQVDYEYDDLYRLTRESITDPVEGDSVVSYTYDDFGNRETRSDANGVVTYVYDENDRLTSETGPLGTANYAYDDNGNRLSRTFDAETITYTYDFENRLLQVQDPAKTITYTYDADGIRVRSEADGVAMRHVVDKNREHAQVIEERDAADALQAFYVLGEHRISRASGGDTRFYLHDGSLSTRALLDASCSVTDTWTYDSFGKILDHSGLTPNPFLFDGEEYDANSGFYYLRARWMDPAAGIFLSRDIWVGSAFEPQSLHKYVFAYNNPVNNRDPSGMMSLSELACVNAIIAGFLAGGLTAAKNIIKHGKIDWMDVAASALFAACSTLLLTLLAGGVVLASSAGAAGASVGAIFTASTTWILVINRAIVSLIILAMEDINCMANLMSPTSTAAMNKCAWTAMKSALLYFFFATMAGPGPEVNYADEVAKKLFRNAKVDQGLFKTIMDAANGTLQDIAAKEWAEKGEEWIEEKAKTLGYDMWALEKIE